MGLFMSKILKIAPGSFGIAPGSCQIPMNQAQFRNTNCPWFPPAYFKAWFAVSWAPGLISVELL